MKDPGIILVGCVAGKRTTTSPASSLYTSPLFGLRRAFARERSDRFGVPWGILSARYGVVSPSDWLAPYNLKLSDLTEEGKTRFAQRVVCGLYSLAGVPLCGVTPPLPDDFVIEVHAGKPYVDALRACIEGGVISHPVEGLQIGEQLAWYKRHLDTPTPLERERTQELERRIMEAELRAQRAEGDLERLERARQSAERRKLLKSAGQQEIF